MKDIYKDIKENLLQKMRKKHVSAQFKFDDIHTILPITVAPSHTVILSARQSGLTRGVSSLKGDVIVVFCYINASKI